MTRSGLIVVDWMYVICNIITERFSISQIIHTENNRTIKNIDKSLPFRYRHYLLDIVITFSVYVINF